MREDFRTTLKPQSKIDLKVLTAKEQKPMCELLEEMIEEKKFNNEPGIQKTTAERV